MVKVRTSKLIVIWTLILLTLSLAASFFLGYLAVTGNFNGSLPWVTAGLGIFDGVLGTVLGYYLNMAKAEHTVGGITFESAKARNFEIKDL